jgi:hypothetical protein
MKLTPELKAFKHYQKNIDRYLEDVKQFWGDDEKLVDHYCRIAAKFGADPAKLMELRQISYERSIERAFR